MDDEVEFVKQALDPFLQMQRENITMGIQFMVNNHAITIQGQNPDKLIKLVEPLKKIMGKDFKTDGHMSDLYYKEVVKCQKKE